MVLYKSMAGVHDPLPILIILLERSAPLYGVAAFCSFSTVAKALFSMSVHLGR